MKRPRRKALKAATSRQATDRQRLTAYSLQSAAQRAGAAKLSLVQTPAGLFAVADSVLEDNERAPPEAVIEAVQAEGFELQIRTIHLQSAAPAQEEPETQAQAKQGPLF